MKKETLNWVKGDLESMTNTQEYMLEQQGILPKILKRLEKGIDPKTTKEIEIILKLYDLQIKAVGMKDIVELLMEIKEELERK